MKSKKIWLMKSEPNVYSIFNLQKDKITLWEGVRNYQARNFMTQSMSEGDLVFFYHSNAEPPGIAGLARISGPAVPDPTQFKKSSPYFDAKATLEKPIWFCVPVCFEMVFSQMVPLSQIKLEPKLSDLPLLQKGQRLSIQPVSLAQAKILLEIALGTKHGVQI